MKIQTRDLWLVSISVVLSCGIFLGLQMITQENNGNTGVSKAVFLQDFGVDFPSKFNISEPKTDFVKAARVAMPAVVRIKSYETNTKLFGTSSDGLKSEGSGVLISPDGYIVTNSHVINGGSKVIVEIIGKKSAEAQIIGIDKLTDLAVLKVDMVNLKYLKLANSDSLQIGEWVLAIGNPYHLSSTVTCGIISAVGRSINLLNEPQSVESFIQTDAVVNAGNSGGALVNTLGQMVGLNTAIFTKSGKFEGYSFAIPSNLVKKITADILDYGKVQRGFLGVTIADEVGEWSGAKIIDLSKDSPAKESGIQIGDILIRINQNVVRSSADLQEQIALYRPGDVLEVVFLRKGVEKKVKVKLSNTFLFGSSEVFIRSGGSLKELGLELREEVKPSNAMANAVVVHSVEKNSPSDRIDLQPGFIISKINHQTISNAKDLMNVLENRKNDVQIFGYYPNESKLKKYTIHRNIDNL